VQHTLTHTHPASDGTVPEWAGLRAYTRNVGIPLAIGAVLLGEGRVPKSGILTPEEAFEPQTVLSELRKRHLLVHENITGL
jgi:saccharopine dehydrogenase-like NADP-dependent oxidoreductase